MNEEFSFCYPNEIPEKCKGVPFGDLVRIYLYTTKVVTKIDPVFIFVVFPFFITSYTYLGLHVVVEAPILLQVIIIATGFYGYIKMFYALIPMYFKLSKVQKYVYSRKQITLTIFDERIEVDGIKEGKNVKDVHYYKEMSAYTSKKVIIVENVLLLKEYMKPAMVTRLESILHERCDGVHNLNKLEKE